MPGLTAGSVETSILLLLGGAAAVAAIGRAACRAIRRRDGVLARETLAAAAILVLAAVHVVQRQPPRQIDSGRGEPIPSASVGLGPREISREVVVVVLPASDASDRDALLLRVQVRRTDIEAAIAASRR